MQTTVMTCILSDVKITNLTWSKNPSKKKHTTFNYLLQISMQLTHISISPAA